MEEQKPFRLVPDCRTWEETALAYVASRPNLVFQIEPDKELGHLGIYMMYQVLMSPNRCPSCGRYNGTTDPGMPDPKKQGGAEHICWKCAETFKPWIIRDREKMKTNPIIYTICFSDLFQKDKGKES